jgi:hypothetical protein
MKNGRFSKCRTKKGGIFDRTGEKEGQVTGQLARQKEKVRMEKREEVAKNLSFCHISR